MFSNLMNRHRHPFNLISLGIGAAVSLLAATGSTFAQQSSPSQTVQERNRQAFLDIVNEGFNKGNTGPVMEILAPDFVNHSPNGEGNRGGTLGTIMAFRQAMPDLVLTVDLVIAEGDLVAGHVTMQGTFERPFMTPSGELPPTGKPFYITMQSIHRFNEQGQSVEEWLSWDNLSMLTQLGALPSTQGQAADPESVIRQFYIFYNEGNTFAQNQLWAEDAVLKLADGTVYQGKADISTFAPAHGQIEIIDLSVEDSIVRWTSVTGGGNFSLEAVVEEGQIQSMTFR
jgi:predicted ester cyclase